MASAIVKVISGTNLGIISEDVWSDERSVAAGGNQFLTSLTQFSQGMLSTAYISHVLQATISQKIGLPSRLAISLVTPTLSYLLNSGQLPKAAQPVALFLKRHVGTMFYVASLVSSVALLCLGKYLFAVPSLAVLGFGALKTRGLVPETLRRGYQQYARKFVTVSGIISDDIVTKCSSLFSLSKYVYDFAVPYLVAKKTPFSQEPRLDLEAARQFARSPQPLDINRPHVRCTPAVPVPEVDIQRLVELFDGIDWERHHGALDIKLKNDVRFTEHHKEHPDMSPEDIRRFARDGLQSYVTEAKEHNMLVGEIADYDKLNGFLKVITDHLIRSDNEVEQVDILFRLAVEGGKYCGPGRFEVAESVHTSIYHDIPNLPFSTKLMASLQHLRTTYFESVYSTSLRLEAGNPSLFQRLIDCNDVHTYNSIKVMIGRNIGLASEAALNDSTTEADPVTDWILDKLVRASFEKSFFQVYTQKIIIEFVQSTIGKSELPKPEFYQYWIQWVENLDLPQEEKDAFIEELGEGKLFGENIEEGGQIKEKFVKLLLLNLGILKKADHELSH